MIAGFYNLRMGQLPAGRLKTLLVTWLVSEVIVFALAVKMLGLGWTILLTIGLSVLGVAVLRRLGLEAAQHLRRTMGMGGARSETVVDGSLTALGALLLIVPGFVSSLAGLALVTPSARQGLMARVLTRGGAPTSKPMGRQAKPDVIDLSPDDWTVVDKR